MTTSGWQGDLAVLALNQPASRNSRVGACSAGSAPHIQPGSNVQKIPLHLALERHSRSNPGDMAFQTPERNWTFEQVDREANRIANGLAALGIAPGDRVACLTRQMAECTLLTLAAQKIGAVCLPVNWRLAPSEIEYIVNEGEACFLVADAEFLPLVQNIRMPRVRRLMATWPAEGVDDLFGWSAGHPDRAPRRQASLDDDALQLYSSGTTGRPKGVAMSHRNLTGVCETVGHALLYGTGGSVTLNVAPTFHIGGLGFALVALYAGGSWPYGNHRNHRGPDARRS